MITKSSFLSQNVHVHIFTVTYSIIRRFWWNAILTKRLKTFWVWLQTNCAAREKLKDIKERLWDFWIAIHLDFMRSSVCVCVSQRACVVFSFSKCVNTKLHLSRSALWFSCIFQAAIRFVDDYMALLNVFNSIDKIKDASTQYSTAPSA